MLCDRCSEDVWAGDPGLRILLPGQPRPKERPQVNHKTMTVFTPDATRKAEKAAAEAMQRIMRGRPPLTGDLEARILCALAGDPTKGDWDNFGKLVSDAGNKVLYKDDRQLSLVTVELRRHDDRPRTLIAVRRRKRANLASPAARSQGGTAS